MANPFRYQGPVDPSRLIDREVELDALAGAAADRVAIRLAAPRRFGKTSLLDAHVARMAQVGHRAVRVDFSKVGTPVDVAGRLSRAFAALPADATRTLERLTSRLGITIGTGGITVGLSRRPAAPALDADQARTVIAELLDLPAALHAEDGGLTVVCFDEFQDLLTADGQMDGLVRSVIQHHGEAAAYVYAGSAPSLIASLFSDRERPLYGQARPLELPPLPGAEAARDISAVLGADGLPVGPEVAQIVAFAAGHPQRTMLLAHHLYNLLADGREDRLAHEALKRALHETHDVHQAVWDTLDRPSRAVVLALADGQAPTGSRVAGEHRIPRSTLQTALGKLVAAQQHAVRADGAPRLLDPLFAEWLRRR